MEDPRPKSEVSPRPDRPATRRPFTVVLCLNCAPAEPALLDALRATVRRCVHGVLVTTDRLPAAIPDDQVGAFVALQPCSVDRDPSGPATWIGPIGDARHVHAVCSWVEGGDWSAVGPAGWWSSATAGRN